jgi:hypothetical protein
VAAVQHYHLGMIMLKVYNPSKPQLGPALRKSREVLEKEMKYHICQISGIALSNPRVSPALLTACKAISTCMFACNIYIYIYLFRYKDIALTFNNTRWRQFQRKKGAGTTT